ncbi:UbiA family prenyltransferase [Candidatus Scalindua japonica]|uniref:UbiA family prenyltransferase n=1 Tax=Candidatus Scalindua japonica TaxID=1284222 RepID=UPI000BDF4EAD|nr:UbiA family prenyltransferase [Candidatus Scalindua japonica]
MVKDYFLHLRPRSWPIVAGHMTVGYLIALPPSEWSGNILSLLIGAFVWAVMLNGGSLAFNSAFDNDTGDIGYLDSPPPVPDGLWLFGLLFMVTGGIISFSVSFQFATVFWICFFMSIAYSCPPVRLKARAGSDIFICVMGYGAFTTYAGWACVFGQINLVIILICTGYIFLFGSLYPLTQIYQFDEDRDKGDKTLAVVLGIDRSIKLSFVCLICAFTIFGVVLFIEHIRFYILIIPLSFWLIILIPWIAQGSLYPQKKGMYRALWAWVATDITIIVIFSILS